MSKRFDILRSELDAFCKRRRRRRRRVAGRELGGKERKSEGEERAGEKVFVLFWLIRLPCPLALSPD